MATLESKFNRLASMIFEIKKIIRTAILMTSVSDLSVYSTKIALVNKLEENDATWKYVTTLFIDKHRRLLKNS